MRRVQTKTVGLILSLTLLFGVLCSGGCATTRADMVRQATAANQAFTIAEHDLNVAFSTGALPVSDHAKLDPTVRATRAAVDSLGRDALDPNFKPSQWRVAYDAFTAAIQPILEAVLQAKNKPAMVAPDARRIN